MKLELLVVILNEEELLEDVLSLFLELEIKGATVLDSVGMGRILATDMPIFAGFRDLMVGSRPYNKTILSVVPSEKVESVVKGITDISGGLDDPGKGLIFTLPVNSIWGLG